MQGLTIKNNRTPYDRLPDGYKILNLLEKYPKKILRKWDDFHPSVIEWQLSIGTLVKDYNTVPNKTYGFAEIENVWSLNGKKFDDYNLLKLLLKEKI